MEEQPQTSSCSEFSIQGTFKTEQERRRGKGKMGRKNQKTTPAAHLTNLWTSMNKYHGPPTTIEEG